MLIVPSSPSTSSTSSRWSGEALSASISNAMLVRARSRCGRSSSISFSLPSHNASQAERNARFEHFIAEQRARVCKEERTMKKIVFDGGVGRELRVTACATTIRTAITILITANSSTPGPARRDRRGDRRRGGAVAGAVIPGVSPVDRRDRRRGARRRSRRGDQQSPILPRYPRLLLLRRPATATRSTTITSRC